MMKLILTVSLFLFCSLMFGDTLEDYYPLSVGDYWIQHTDIFGGGNNPVTFTMENEAIDQINGEDYVRKLNWLAWDDGTAETIWYIWLRAVTDGVEMAAFGEEPNVGTAQIFDPPILMFTNDMLILGNTYEIEIPQFGGTLSYTTQQVGASVTVPAGTFTNCLVIALAITDSTNTITQESEFYYAYQVGEVRNYGWNQNYEFYDFELIEYEVQSGSQQIIIPANDYKLCNYPNPFNPSTIISFELNTENTEDTEISIYNLKGQKIKTFPINQLTNQPVNQIVWDGKDKSGKAVSSGIYFYKLKSGNIELSRKCLLLK